jgi:protein CpxP
MKSTRILALVVAGAFLLGATAVVAQHMHDMGGPDGHFEHMLGFYADKLDLTSAQQDQIKAIWTKEKPALQPLMQQMKQNHEAMKTLEAAGPFDEAKTRALATQGAQTMIELDVQHARIKSEMLQLLTADQKTKYQQLEAEHDGHMRNHMPSPPPED